MDCYSAKSTEDVRSCQLFAEDYDECLHHRKEKARAQKIADELARREAAGHTGLIMSEKRKAMRLTLEDLGIVN